MKRQLFKEFSFQCHSNEEFDGLRDGLIAYLSNNKHPTNNINSFQNLGIICSALYNANYTETTRN